MKPLLYHFYALSNIQGPDSIYKIEVDHIIPQTLFKNSTINNKEVMMHSIFNLALLPKDENTSKGKDRLSGINNQWLKDQIVKYTSIPESDFFKYSDISNYESMKDLREGIFLEAFTIKRDQILNN